MDNSKAYATLSTTHIFFNYVLLLLYLHYVLIIDHRNIIVINYYSVQILKNLNLNLTFSWAERQSRDACDVSSWQFLPVNISGSEFSLVYIAIPHTPTFHGVLSWPLKGIKWYCETSYFCPRRKMRKHRQHDKQNKLERILKAY